MIMCGEQEMIAIHQDTGPITATASQEWGRSEY